MAKHGNVAIFVPHNGCPNMCSFCNQRTISGRSEQPDAETVRSICEKAAREMTVDAKNAQIAFFGGSFTAIERGLMISLLEAASEFIENGSFSGIRISTRPDCIDEETLDILGRSHVTNIELGAQSMDDRVLAMNRRGHTAADVENASRLIKRRGFALGLQMMVGLYGENPRDIPEGNGRTLAENAMETARRIAELEPDEVRIYPVAVLEGTELARLWQDGVYFPPDVNEAVKCCAELIPFFEERGIRILRVGLHASDGVGTQALAGAYHPAFRELCDNELYLRKILQTVKASGEKCGTVYVSPRELSKALGQKRANIGKLAALGYDIRIAAGRELAAGELRFDAAQNQL